MPTMGSYAVRASQAFMAAGDVEMAAEYADRAVAGSPNRQEFRLAAAAAFQAAGQPDIAREHLMAVASLDAEDDRAKEMLRNSMRPYLANGRNELFCVVFERLTCIPDWL